ncbi:MAG: aspartate/glutamate racemase family protein [Bacteroidia bacterium]|nr:aspartate/glutamate racemase family protein [Bacteroidia bacterium]
MHSEKPKYLGMLGLGSRASLYYLERLNAVYNEKNGGYSTCPVKLLNANFDHINPFLPNQFDVLEKRIWPYLVELVSMGVEGILVPNITLHETLDRCWQQLGTNIPLHHPLEATCVKLRQMKKNSVIVLGSRYTMTSTYIPDYFKKQGITVEVPQEKMIETSENMRQLLYKKNEKENDMEEFSQLIKKLTQSTTVVLACTELSTLNLNNIEEGILDMASLQIESALHQII